MPAFPDARLHCGRYRLPIAGDGFRPLVMGILNVTPDSFSDGGQFAALDGALSHAERMIADGVDIIDIGGESTRPGAPPVSVAEELDRVMPVVYALRDRGKPLSVDTRRPLVMREALMAGADMINDIEGFRHPDSLAAVSDSDCAVSCTCKASRRPCSTILIMRMCLQKSVVFFQDGWKPSLLLVSGLSGYALIQASALARRWSTT